MVKWSLAAELLAAMMIVVLMVYYREKKLAVTRKGKVYRGCLGLSLATVLLNAVCVYTIEHTEQVPRAVNLILNSAYFLAAVLTCSVIVLYLCHLILEHVYDKRHLMRASLCISGATLGYLLLVLWNLSSGVLFSFAPGGNYRRGPLNRVGYALMAAELLLLAVCYVQNRASVNRPMVKLMHTLPPLAIFLAAFQLAYPQILLNGMMMAMADLILFISFQSSRIETDSLTGIGNRNSFFAELSLRVAGRQQFQIVLLSLQQFVTINQRFGHQRGDAFLYEVARYLDGLCRQARAFRFGNVEFAVVFPWRGETEAADNFYLDDFGTGYSNLSCVLDLPFECVKLDQSLVAEFPDDQRADLLVRTLVSLFHDMGLQVVAEGVKAAPQAEALARYGADWIQGYYYARPMPESELIPFLKEKNHAPQGGAKEVLV